MPEILAVLSLALVAFCVLSGFITYGLGIYIFSQNPSSTVNRLFLAAALLATCWGVGEFLIWNSTDYEGFLFWLRASSFWSVFLAVAVHFVLALTEQPAVREKRYGTILVGLYLPAVIIALIGFTTDLIYQVSFQPGTGYIYQPNLTTPVYLVVITYATLAMLWALYAGFSSWRRARRERERRQNLLIFAGIMAIVGFDGLSGVALPFIGIHTVNLVFIGIFIFSALITYAIQRYELFTLTPEAAVMDIISTMPDGLILTDMDGTISLENASAAEILGVSKIDLHGQPFRKFIPGNAYASIMAAAEKGRFSDLEVVPENRNGRIASINGVIVRGPEMKPAGFVLILRDVTDRKAAETALQLSKQKLSLLAGVTTHDIANAVTALSWYLDLLQEEYRDRESPEVLERSIETVGTIKQHIQFFREYRMIGTYGAAWQSIGPMNTQIAGEVQHPGVEIDNLVAPVEIYADKLLPKVIYNLLDNAIRHGGKVSRIQITTSELDNVNLLLVFEDDGVGVRDEEKAKIFEYGYGKNSGFGLAFVRDVLAVTDIGICETGVAGMGARFEILIPPQAWRWIEGKNPVQTIPN